MITFQYTRENSPILVFCANCGLP